MIRRLSSDLRLALRRLRRTPGFTAVAVLTLALGIGANAAVFSVVRAVLIRPLPFRDPGRLVQVWETRPGEESRRASPADYLDWRARGRSFSSLAAYDVRAGNLVGGSGPERVTYATVSSNFFRTLGVTPARGRDFASPAAAGPGPATAILSSGFWRRRFGGDPAALGRSIDVDGTRYTVVGIMPSRAGFPRGAQLWVRAPHDVPGIAGFEGDIRRLRDAWYFRVVGRLADGVGLDGARAEMKGLAARLEAEHPVSNLHAGIRLVPLHRQLVGDVRTTLLVLFGAVGLVLLIACANVANLTLVRASRRRRSLAIRTALGAGRGHLLTALLAESLVLGLAGGGLGLVLARIGTPLLGRLLAGDTVAAGHVAVDGPVLLFSLAATLAAAVGSGALPALLASRVEPAAALAGRGSAAREGRAGARVRSGLVVAECALALLLVLGAALTLRSLWRLQNVDPGFRPDGLVTAELSIPGGGAPGGEEAGAIYGRVLERVRTVPDVASAAVAMTGPADDGPGAGLRIEGRPQPEGALPNASWQVVSPGYFRTAGIEVVRGRSFDRRDVASSVPVAVVNRSMARAHWSDADPIGQRINTGLDGRDVWVTIVGVVGDTRNEGLASETSPEMYRPLAQPTRFFRGDRAMLLLRTSGARPGLLAGVRRAIGSVEPDMPVFDVRTGRELLGGSLARPRSILLLLGAFAGLALVLGAIGIYGVLAYAVRLRRRELGVRAALGARPVALVRLVLGSSLRLVAAGLGLGLLAALVATRALRSLLFGIGTTDPVTFAAAAAVLLCVGAAASALPALRAARVDPAAALREE